MEEPPGSHCVRIVIHEAVYVVNAVGHILELNQKLTVQVGQIHFVIELLLDHDLVNIARYVEAHNT